MAEIAPFRGILYTPSAGNPSSLLAPPYDVIAEPERQKLEALSPHNCVRLILPRPESGHPESDDSKYTHAASLFRAWQADGTLARDQQPAIYRYHQIFRSSELGDREVTRKGFIARVRLHPFDEGIILPHERTLSGPKIDRLKLMQKTRAHFSQIFGLYPDPARDTDHLFATAESTPPAIEAQTSDGVTQRLFRLTDRDAIHALTAFMAARKVYIADGHHRYETMLTLRDQLRAEATPPANPRSSVEYGVMFFCNMDDPGLVVFPTHRVLHGLVAFDRDSVLTRARDFFTVEQHPLGTPQSMRAALTASSEKGVTFGLATPGHSQFALLRLRPDLDLSRIPAVPTAPSLRTLDVTILHSILFETILGIDREAQAAQTNLRYVKSWEAAAAELSAPGVQAVFLMNPTKVSQVKAVSDVGEVMPQKSTFFYPKIASGIVINPIDPAEEVTPV